MGKYEAPPAITQRGRILPMLLPVLVEMARITGEMPIPDQP